MPKGYKKTTDTRQKTLRPPPEQLSRPMVDWQMLKVPIYRTKVVDDSTGKPDNNVNQVEIHPLEWDAQLVFKVPTHKQGLGFSSRF